MISYIYSPGVSSKGKEMESNMIFMLSTVTVLVLCSSFSNAQTVGSPPSMPHTPTPAPAPAPVQKFVNLKDLLTLAGPFQTFLNYIESTQLLQTFQNQANNTNQGITIFVPKDQAFSSLKKPSLSNLTPQQLQSLLLFHALPKYYSLAEFRNLSQTNPVTTFGGGSYMLNFADISGTVNIDSGWTKTNISSSIYSTDPVAVYQVDKVLLPEAIYGTATPSSTLAAAPSSDASTTTGANTTVAGINATAAGTTNATATKTDASSSFSYVMNRDILVISGVMMFLFM